MNTTLVTLEANQVSSDRMPAVTFVRSFPLVRGLEFDRHGGGLCKIGTPLRTPPMLPLERGTAPAKDSCGLSVVGT